MTFIQVLIFAFGFFGVWRLSDAAMANPPAVWRPLVVAIVFILVAYLLGSGKIG